MHTDTTMIRYGNDRKTLTSEEIFQFNRVDNFEVGRQTGENCHRGSAAIFPLSSSSVSEHAEVLMAGKA